jgi:hypothetical protein
MIHSVVPLSPSACAVEARAFVKEFNIDQSSAASRCIMREVKHKNLQQNKCWGYLVLRVVALGAANPVS